MKRLLIAAGCVAMLAAFGCKKEEPQTDTPAGHPDELRDSTRLDSAPAMPDTTGIRADSGAVDTLHGDTSGSR